MKKITHTQYVSFRNIVTDCGYDAMMDKDFDLKVCDMIQACHLIPDAEMPDKVDFTTFLLYDFINHCIRIQRLSMEWIHSKMLGTGYWWFTSDDGKLTFDSMSSAFTVIAIFTD